MFKRRKTNRAFERSQLTNYELFQRDRKHFRAGCLFLIILCVLFWGGLITWLCW